MEQQTGSKLGKELSPCLFNLHAEYIMQNARLEEAEDGIKTARRNINTLRYADDTTVVAESEEQLKSFLMRVKEESKKVGFKLNIQKANKIMASGLITSGQTEEEKVETVTDFYFLGLQNHWMVTAAMKLKDTLKKKRCLFLGRKAMINHEGVLKTRDITLPTKIRIVKAMVFPVDTYRCESWTIKKPEC